MDVVTTHGLRRFIKLVELSDGTRQLGLEVVPLAALMTTGLNPQRELVVGWRVELHASVAVVACQKAIDSDKDKGSTPLEMFTWLDIS